MFDIEKLIGECIEVIEGYGYLEFYEDEFLFKGGNLNLNLNCNNNNKGFGCGCR